ncbi:hypothetical protein GCM10010172_66640 [Paractinoplanes ferrugineus]|uniref:DUF5666 domain-containing protein n=1 Tax=Paractinoplanes ferrugineus TaxID=113564 RepID=A0A919J3B4_9ACTN|nr:hypothetical protein [Actinoplanes ferrugineus]GIE13175.1 hypothetical protein Afe05nite_50150 [Actinoplanes ferrugineus]
MKQSDQPTIMPGPASGVRSRRVRRAALAVALGGGLALGATGLAYADDNSTAPSAPPAPAAVPSGPTAVPSGAAPAGPPAGPEADNVQHRPHLDGTVTQLGSGKIMIVDREGFTRQINIKAVPDGVAVGTRVHAEGTVDKDGVSLDAAEVGVAPQPGPGGRGGPGERGPRDGGPRGGAHQDPRPPAPEGSGAPAAPAPEGSAAPTAPAAPVPSGSAAAPAPTTTS